MPSPSFRSDRGSALISALLIMVVFMSLGVATLALVDTQQGESRRERERESSFALAEGVLNSQIYLLSRQWPGTSGLAYPEQCSKATATNVLCPDTATLAKSYTGADFNAGLDWTTEVHDNVAGSQDFYDDAEVRLQPRYDSNRDGIVWVRAQSFVRGKRRTLIALIRAERLDAPFPRNVVVANKLTVLPSGNQTYVGTAGSYAILRCIGPGGTTLSASECQVWSKEVNVGPNGDVRVIPGQASALTPETIERFRETAKTNGTYFTGPCAPTLSGEVVFIENVNCVFDPPGTVEYNTAAAPGVLILGSGAFEMRGNSLYNGVVYHINGSDGTGPALSTNVVTVSGNACIRGAAVIDGAGGLMVGSSNGANRCGGNIDFNANAANNLRAFGTAGIVQNSFREIVADD